MKKPLFIYGAGGLGKEVLSMVRGMPEWQVSGFIDDQVAEGTLVNGVSVKGGLPFLQTLHTDHFVVLAFGDPLTKTEIMSKLANAKIAFPVLIHPNALIQDATSVKLNEGTIVTAGAILTTDITIGKHVLINLNSTIGHDCQIGNFTSIMPGVNIAGQVTIGACVMVGTGSSIRNRLLIESGATIGMGSVVIRNVPANAVVAGVPARPIVKK